MDAISEDIELPQSLSALVLATRESLLRAHYTENSLKCLDRVCRKWGAPHLRHSKAMHLLQSDVNLVYIRDLLGHVSIATTEVYARADNEMKRRALEAAYPSEVATSLPPWQTDTDLLEWLKSLGH